MSSLNLLNPKAEYIKKQQAMAVQITAASGMQDWNAGSSQNKLGYVLCGVFVIVLGPKGTMKMLVGSSGQIKLTKDGNVLLHEMQIQHPTASLIARTATAQDDITVRFERDRIIFVGRWYHIDGSVHW